jgi:hypothetical protein
VVKRPRREVDHSPSSSVEVKNGRSIPPLLHTFHGVVLNLSNHTIIRRFIILTAECFTNNQEVLGRIDSLRCFDTAQIAQKRIVQQFFYSCVCIRCSGNVFTEPLPSNDTVIHIQTQNNGTNLLNTPFRWAQ